MRLIGAMFLIVSSLSACSYDSEGQAINIIQGDVFGFQTIKYNRIRVYLNGIKTHNPQEKFGKESRGALRKKIHFKDVKLRNIVDLTGKGDFSDKKYTVYSAEVFVNGENVNEYMVREGFAFADGNKYRKLEAQAKSSKKGLWATFDEDQ